MIYQYQERKIGDNMTCTIHTKPIKIRISHNCLGYGRKYPRNTIMNRNASTNKEYM